MVFVTGASRRGSIGDAIARNLASIGFDVAFGYWDGYDSEMPWGAHPTEHEALAVAFAVASRCIQNGDAAVVVLTREQDSRRAYGSWAWDTSSRQSSGGRPPA